MTSLLDMLKETDLRVGLTELFTSATPREATGRRSRGGSCCACTGWAPTSVCGESAPVTMASYTDLYYTRRRYITRDHLRVAIARVVDAIFAARTPHLGGGHHGLRLGCKKFGAFDQNLLTEWHPRYRGPGVMVYWHMDKKAAGVSTRSSSPRRHRKWRQ